MRTLCLAAAVVLAGLTTNARAGTYDLDLTTVGGYGFPTTVDLVLTTGAAQGGGYVVTGITGTADGVAVTGPVNWYNVGNDNILFPTGNSGILVDGSGIGFNDPDYGELLLNYFSSHYFIGNVGGAEAFSVDSFAAAASAPVPEPATLALLATGLLGIVAMRRLTVRSIVSAAGLAGTAPRMQKGKADIALARNPIGHLTGQRRQRGHAWHRGLPSIRPIQV